MQTAQPWEKCLTEVRSETMNNNQDCQEMMQKNYVEGQKGKNH